MISSDRLPLAGIRVLAREGPTWLNDFRRTLTEPAEEAKSPISPLLARPTPRWLSTARVCRSASIRSSIRASESGRAVAGPRSVG